MNCWANSHSRFNAAPDETAVVKPWVESSSCAIVTVAAPVEPESKAIADILYLALPETPETKNLIDKRRLDLLKSTCGIVNIGRQSALDYEVLCDKLENNDLAGAILDVFNPEPIDKNSRLWNIKNLIITPHVSSDDNGNYVKLTLELFVKNLKLFIKKKELTNQIDKELGY